MTTFRSKSERSLNLIFGVGIFVSTLFFYLLTSYPTVAYIDSGELAVVNWTLGIAHPSGYPLFTNLGRLFSLIPIELIKTQILQGAISTAAACCVMFFLSLRLLKPHSLMTIISIALACVLFGVAPLIWSQGVTNEVYSLHLLLITIILTLLISPFSERMLYLGAFVVGLSFCNHMSTVLLLPVVAAFLYQQRKRLAQNPRSLLIAVGFASLATTLYLYLPIRSAQDPIFNWGQPHEWGNFVRHVTGWQYRVWMFDRTADEIFKSLGSFIVILANQFPFPYWLMIGLGIYAAWNKHRKIAILLTTLIVFNILYALNFNIPDIDNYLLSSLAALFLYSLFGLQYVFDRRKNYLQVITGVLGALVVWSVAVNWTEYNQSGNTSALDGVHNYYASADSNSLIFCCDWDYVSPWLYSHFYLKERPDLLIVDNELVRRSWYGDWIRHADPQLHENIKPEIEAFLPHVRKFEAQLDYDPRQIEQAYRNLLMKIMRYPGRMFYFDQSVELAFQPPGSTQFSGQLVRVIRDGETPDAANTRITQPPQFGRPMEALNERETLHLRKYNRMIELAKSAAQNADSTTSSR